MATPSKIIVPPANIFSIRPMRPIDLIRANNPLVNKAAKTNGKPSPNE